MNIQIVGGTNRDRDIIVSCQDGILEGLKCLSVCLGGIFDKKPSDILINVESTKVLSVFLSIHANKKLTPEVALSEILVRGGEIAFMDSRGTANLQYTVLPLRTQPDPLKHPTRYNLWWKNYREVVDMIKNNKSAAFTTVRYKLMDSMAFFTYTDNVREPTSTIQEESEATV